MYLWIVGALLVLGGLVYSYIGTHPQGVLDGEREGDVRTLIGAFGNQLDTVSLFAPDAAEEIRAAYGPYATPELIDAWIADPMRAPGRLTSSPWPDHIDITSVTMTSPTSYMVEGTIALVTSGGDAGTVPVSITVEEREGRFLITAYAEQRGTSAEALPKAGSIETVTAALGESVTAFGVTVTPDEVLEDSRCPANANCIQAGTVRVKGELTDGMGTSEMTFELATPVTGEVTIVTLTDVLPVKVSTRQASTSEYRLTFTFTFEYR